ncbi:glycosyltransferase family 9 protein [Candidatus Pacearchaeota archaeon]|nr:glycosyltransferase family 9 protein [Candidatus Pacearchaeota archaeon]
MKIAIIKLGAKGDVVRTLSILPALKKKYPESEITWITKENISDLIDNNPHISRVLTIPLKVEDSFDLLYNFDIEREATNLAGEITAHKKYGFCFEDGFISAFNLEAEYYLNTIFDDELKKSNKKTYEEMMFGLAEIPYEGYRSEIFLEEKERDYAASFLSSNNLSGRKIIGIHMGAGPRWLSKAWSTQKIKEFIRRMKTEGYEIILFGGPDEVEGHKALKEELLGEGLMVYSNNPENSNKEFASLLDVCDKVVCSDSFALHVSLALGKPTISLFFCTSPDEVEGHGLLKKIISPKLYEFFPERMDQYSEDLINSISAEDVAEAVLGFDKKD